MNIQGTYTDITEIGSGGGGTVFRAYHVRMQKYVVLKKIHDNLQNNVDIRAELNILKNLRHSYLPTVLDFIEENGSIYTVMDYIPGESFETMLCRGVRFTQAQVVKYAAQLGEVLAYLHGQKTPIIHGDIKPANVMLTPEDNICLIDFNISQLRNGVINPNMGYTPGYASPEQVQIMQTLKQYYAQVAPAQPAAAQSEGTVLLNADAPAQPAAAQSEGTVLLNANAPAQPATAQSEGTVLLNANAPAQPVAMQGASYRQPPVLQVRMDERSDIYSAGATLYAIMCGMIPNPDFKQVVPIERLVENCSEGLANLIHQCMAVDPNKRLSGAAAFVKAVNSIAKVDKRYKRLVHRQEFSIILCILGMAACVGVTVLGRERMLAENVGVYNQLVAQMEELQTEKGERADEDFEELYDEAVTSFPQFSGAYYQKALRMYYGRAYAEMVDFIWDEVLSHERDFSDEERGNFYFLLANACLESDDLTNAVNYYRTAVEYNPYDSTFYSDYAIALAGIGDLDGAQRILADAEDMGLANDKILLAKGEIAAKQNQFDEAGESFLACAEETEDAYVLLRAYILWSEIYDSDEPTEESLQRKAEILTEGKAKVESEDQAVLLERLAQAYIDLGSLTQNNEYNLKAVETLQEIVSLGWDTYVTHNNIGILYETAGQYSDAVQEFQNMLSLYGDDYRIYKRLAFLEVDIQGSKANRNRDYAQFLVYYEKAKELFADSDVRADSDMEMQLLDQVLEQLEDGGWFSE